MHLGHSVEAGGRHLGLGVGIAEGDHQAADEQRDTAAESNTA